MSFSDCKRHGPLLSKLSMFCLSPVVFTSNSGHVSPYCSHTKCLWNVAEMHAGKFGFSKLIVHLPAVSLLILPVGVSFQWEWMQDAQLCGLLVIVITAELERLIRQSPCSHCFFPHLRCRHSNTNRFRAMFWCTCLCCV